MSPMKPNIFTCAFSLAVAVELICAGSGRAQALGVTVATVQAPSNQDVEIPINVKGAAGVGAMHLELTYDPAILEAKSAEKGSLASGNALLDFNIPRPGKIIIGIVSLDGIQGDGPVATIRFAVRGQAGHKCSLPLESVRAWDGKTHLEHLVRTDAGEFTTTGSGSRYSLNQIVLGASAISLFLVAFVSFQKRGRGAGQGLRAS